MENAGERVNESLIAGGIISAKRLHTATIARGVGEFVKPFAPPSLPCLRHHLPGDGGKCFCEIDALLRRWRGIHLRKQPHLPTIPRQTNPLRHVTALVAIDGKTPSDDFSNKIISRSATSRASPSAIPAWRRKAS